MAGHSKWKNIQHRKGAQDAKRGKAFTKLLKEITVAVKMKGPDPEANPRLRLAILNCKGANLPKDNIARAIKKASGAGGNDYIEVTFEGHGIEGVGIFIECATDNNTRTVANIRSYFNKYGGSLGKDGCLEFIFKRKGIFLIEQNTLDEDDFTMDMIDAGAEDIFLAEGCFHIECEMQEFGKIQKILLEKNIEPIEAGLERIPLSTRDLSESSTEKVMKLIDMIEADDDVQKVFHNISGF